jgi:putative aldouronate transport system permease protein
MRKKKTAGNNKIADSRADKTFYRFSGIIMFLVFLLYAWPLWFIVIASFSNPDLVTSGQVWLWPKGFHLGGYRLITQYKDIITGYRNSVFYTVAGTLINMIMTVCAAYPLSRMNFFSRKFFTILFIFTMYFGGGLVPYFLQVRNLGLYNSPWSMMIPSAVSMFNVLLLRSYFMYGIPKGMEEAAELEGANTLQLLVHVVLPLSMPTLAVLVLYYSVGHWNDYFSALIFLRSREWLPLQSVLREILIVGKIDMTTTGAEMEAIAQKLKIAQTLKYAVIIVSTVPLMTIYPFIQRHLVKGIMLGAVKG